MYDRQVFCADMKSSQISESINSVIKKYLDSQTKLFEFFDHWERFLKEWCHAELVADVNASQGNPKVSFSEMLKQALVIYTPTIYKEFEVEYEHFLDYNGQKENIHE